MLAIFKKEFKAYFLSAGGYIFMGMFLFLTGIFFTLYDIASSSADFLTVIAQMSFLFLFIIPIITMRTLSEEVKNKTDQLLLTAPIKVRDIVVGKFLAAALLLFVTLAVTFLYPLIMSVFGTVSYPEIFVGYAGILLLGSSFIAIGIFISSLTENVIISAVGSFAAVLFIMLMDTIAGVFPTDSLSGMIFSILLILAVAAYVYRSTKNIVIPAGIALVGIIIAVVLKFVKAALFEGFIVNFFGWISLIKNDQTFSMGVLNLTAIVFFISVIFVFLFLTIRVIEKRRWS